MFGILRNHPILTNYQFNQILKSISSRDKSPEADFAAAGYPGIGNGRLTVQAGEIGGYVGESDYASLRTYTMWGFRVTLKSYLDRCLILTLLKGGFPHI